MSDDQRLLLVSDSFKVSLFKILAIRSLHLLLLAIMLLSNILNELTFRRNIEVNIFDPIESVVIASYHNLAN